MLIFKTSLLALTSSLLPFVSIVWLCRRRAKGWADWALALSLAFLLSLLAFIATPWAMTSYYLRYLLMIALAFACYLSFRRVKAARHEINPSLKDKLASALRLILLLLLLLLDIEAVRTYFYPPPYVELTFPLSNGVYYVMQGGNSLITNPFHRSGSSGQETYAVDVVKLNWAGNRAAGIYPRALSSYAVFGETVYSPCGGEIVEALDGVSDNPIGEEGHHPSNHVVIRCKGVKVTLAHMTAGSILVREGQSVEEGEPIGRVGNAGHTSEPHLHVDAVRDGTIGIEPVPISFNGRTLSLNSIVMR